MSTKVVLSPKERRRRGLEILSHVISHLQILERQVKYGRKVKLLDIAVTYDRKPVEGPTIDGYRMFAPSPVIDLNLRIKHTSLEKNQKRGRKK